MRARNPFAPWIALAALASGLLILRAIYPRASERQPTAVGDVPRPAPPAEGRASYVLPVEGPDASVAPAPTAPAGHDMPPLPGREVTEAPSTLIVQMLVSHRSATLLATIPKPELPYRPTAEEGSFRLVARDSANEAFDTCFDAPGLLPEGFPERLLDAEGRYVEGDRVLLAEVPVLVKIPGNLVRPIAVRIEGPSGPLGSFLIER